MRFACGRRGLIKPGPIARGARVLEHYKFISVNGATKRKRVDRKMEAGSSPLTSPKRFRYTRSRAAEIFIGDNYKSGRKVLDGPRFLADILHGVRRPDAFARKYLLYKVSLARLKLLATFLSFVAR